MSEIGTTGANPIDVLVAVRVGRHGWVRKLATLQYEAGRLIRAEGIDFAHAGPAGLTGTMYVVKESLCRDGRSVIRVERQRIVNGIVVDVQNWGEIDDPPTPAADSAYRELEKPAA